METGAYRLRETLPQMVLGAVIGAIPGTVVGAAIPAVIGFALLGITTPQRITTYFLAYMIAVMVGGLLGAVLGGSAGACRRLERGCPEIETRQIRTASVVGAILALPLAYAIWLLARRLAQLFF